MTQKLSEVADIVGGFAFKSEDLGQTGIPVVKIADIQPPLVNISSSQRIPMSKVNGLDRYLLKNGDVVMAMTGATTGKVGRYRHSDPAYLNQRVAKLSAKRGRDFDDYIYALVTQPNFDTSVLNNAVGSAQPNISTDNIGRIEIPFLPFSEQFAVGRVIATLDDKIELNRKMSATLEAMARALFKSWFVDFDPVRAKMEGRATGLSAEISLLFPNSFESYSPAGWLPRPLSFLCSSIERGVTPKYSTGTRRFIINQKVNRGVSLDLSAMKELAIDTLVPTEKHTKDWDILVNCLGEGTLGRVHLFRSGKSFAVDQHMSICRPKSAAIGAFAYECLASIEGQNAIEASKTGSTGMTMLNISKLRDFSCLWPGLSLIDEYGKIALPIWKRIGIADANTLTLRELRDALLPKLISGEIRVSEAERILEKSA